LICWNIDGNDIPRISDEAKAMETIANEMKIRVVVCSCESSKTLGYNGFNFGFIERTWETIGKDFTEVVMDFFCSDRFP